MKLIGTLITILVSVLSFLVHSFVSSLETKANSESKFNTVRGEIREVNHKLDLTLCYLNKKHCLRRESNESQK